MSLRRAYIQLVRRANAACALPIHNPYIADAHNKARFTLVHAKYMSTFHKVLSYAEVACSTMEDFQTKSGMEPASGGEAAMIHMA